MHKNAEYDFSKTIRIVRLKANGPDIMFYTALASILLAAILLILCFKGGVFGIYFDLWRVLVSIPLIILVLLPLQLLKELREYVPKLAKQQEWTLEELMKMTGKDEKETVRIMTRVLESAFIVDPSCLRQVD